MEYETFEPDGQDFQCFCISFLVVTCHQVQASTPISLDFTPSGVFVSHRVRWWSSPQNVANNQFEFLWEGSNWEKFIGTILRCDSTVSLIPQWMFSQNVELQNQFLDCKTKHKALYTVLEAEKLVLLNYVHAWIYACTRINGAIILEMPPRRFVSSFADHGVESRTLSVAAHLRDSHRCSHHGIRL